MNQVSPGVDLGWLKEYGLTEAEIGRLFPSVPGAMTADISYYVNSDLPGKIFEGRTQGSLPITPGRWFLIPEEIVQAHPNLLVEVLGVAAARSLLSSDDTRGLSSWTAGG